MEPRSRRRFACFLLASLALRGGAVAGDAVDSNAGPIRVLFIGNSLVFENSLPLMLSRLSEYSGEPRRIEAADVTMPRWTLERHWDSGKALDEIRGSKWDYVVLQEQFDRPLVSPEKMGKYAGLFDAEIRKSGARTIVFMHWTWAGKDAATQDATTAAFTELGKSLNVAVAPAGPAWYRVIAEKPTLALYQSDRRHPTQAGTYLTAAVFFSVVYGKPPDPLRPMVPQGLNADDVALLDDAAWKTVAPRMTR